MNALVTPPGSSPVWIGQRWALKKRPTRGRPLTIKLTALGEGSTGRERVVGDVIAGPDSRRGAARTIKLDVLLSDWERV